MKQITDTVLMVRPLHFCSNEETAVNNYFQQTHAAVDATEILEKAQQEFDEFVQALRDKGIRVIVLEDRTEVRTPDSIFPNNWISTHNNGDVVLYPMYAQNRRLERREDVLEILENEGFELERVIDLSDAEKEGLFLEGTGSMILDHENAVAYCALSGRSDEELFREFCEIMGYRPLIFKAYQTVNGKRELIYHTNVVMMIGETFAILCAESIDDVTEREKVIRSLQRCDKEIVLITEAQLESFAGNMLQVAGNDDDRFLVMSRTAAESLTQEQLHRINEHTTNLVVDIPTIERFGGGSARCMLCEIFLPEKNNGSSDNL